jgi:hypothetical protein
VPLDRSVEVAVEVAVPLRCGVVEQAAVELDRQAVVLGVAVDHAQGGRRAYLPLRPWQPVGALHAAQVALLEHGARSRRDVLQDGRKPSTPRSPFARREHVAQADRGRAPRLHSTGQHVQRGELGRRRNGHVERCLLVSQARRSDVPLRASSKVCHAVHADARRRHTGALAVDRDVDHRVAAPARTLGRPKSRDVAQSGRPREQDGRPRALQPGRLAGVVHVHARVQADPLPAAQHPAYLRVRHARRESLEPGDHTRLVVEQLRDRLHRPTVGDAGARCQ